MYNQKIFCKMRELFEYQRNGIKRMTEIEDKVNEQIKVHDNGVGISFASKCGFLADPTGSGKTCTMLHFIKSRHRKIKREETSDMMDSEW